MKFKVLCRRLGDLDGHTWEENYEKDAVKTIADAWQWAEATVKSFNDTLRAGEHAREVVDVEADESTAAFKKEHDWEKTNKVTILKGGLMYDTYVCTACGITAKRYSLSWPPTIDSKYRAKVYRRCDTAQRHLEKRARALEGDEGGQR